MAGGADMTPYDRWKTQTPDHLEDEEEVDAV
jgi:hypothetical protein